jgi:hypothetical protein
MKLKNFYTDVVSTEIACLNYLHEQGITATQPEEPAPCLRCGSSVKISTRKTRRGEEYQTHRCTRTGCQTTRSIRQAISIFPLSEMNTISPSKLSLCQQMEVIKLWTLDMPTGVLLACTNISKKTLHKMAKYFRTICSRIVSVDRRGQMIGTAAIPIQIDEARFAGRRKYNRGRMLSGDRPPSEQNLEAPVINQRNHGRRIDGPWVFGLKHGQDVRYFYVGKRDATTLLHIIRRECFPRSHIHSDEWPAYRTLSTLGYVHSTVNHQTNHVNPENGANIQALERSWLDSKCKILKKMRGVPKSRLQSHLDEFCYRQLRKNVEDLFISFLNDIREVHV